jgi:hypothetical protein
MMIEMEKDVEASVAGAAVEFGRDAKEATLGRVLKEIASWKEKFHLRCPGVGRGGQIDLGARRSSG